MACSLYTYSASHPSRPVITRQFGGAGVRPLDKGGWSDHVITHRYSCSQTVVAPVDDASSKRSENIIIGLIAQLLAG